MQFRWSRWDWEGQAGHMGTSTGAGKRWDPIGLGGAERDRLGTWGWQEKGSSYWSSWDYCIRGTAWAHGDIHLGRGRWAPIGQLVQNEDGFLLVHGDRVNVNVYWSTGTEWEGEEEGEEHSYLGCPAKQPKLVLAPHETKCLFRLFRFFIETASFFVLIEPKQNKDQPKHLCIVENCFSYNISKFQINSIKIEALLIQRDKRAFFLL